MVEPTTPTILCGRLFWLAACLVFITTSCTSTTDVVSEAQIDESGPATESAGPVISSDPGPADATGEESADRGSSTSTIRIRPTLPEGQTESTRHLDRSDIVLICMNEHGPADLDGIQGCLGRYSNPGESELDANRSRDTCRDYGGDACIDLLFASSASDDWLFGLSCGGRGLFPCDETAAPPTDPSDDGGVDDPIAGGDLATEFDALIRGTVVQYFFRDVNRPIYGWVDETTVEYCADGSFNMRSQGERRTVLDNTEYRSDAGSGSWSVGLIDESAVVIEHFVDDGRILRLPVSGSTSNQSLPSGVTAQTIGPASC